MLEVEVECFEAVHQLVEGHELAAGSGKHLE